jgi:ABC-type multidrug transport system ATPase subunit/ABC-type transport system involved in cytochrome c biogenesis permease component
VPQEISLYDELSAHENLIFWGKMYRVENSVLEKRINLLLSDFGLFERRNDKIKTFSGGMKRRINIAASLLHEPKIVFMDEPTVGIDPQSRNNIYDALAQLKNKGTTILYTTHYMEEAERFSDRVGIIDAGKIIAEGTVEELKKMSGTSEEIQIKVQSLSEQQILSLQQKFGDQFLFTEGLMSIHHTEVKKGINPGVKFLRFSFSRNRVGRDSKNKSRKSLFIFNRKKSARLMFTIARKDLQLFFKDKKALLLTFITPIGLITLLVFAFGGNSKERTFDPIPVQICDQDNSKESEKFIADLKKSEQIKIEKVNFEEGFENVKKGKRLAMLVIEKKISIRKFQMVKLLSFYIMMLHVNPEFGLLQSVLMGEIMNGAGRKGIKATVMRRMEEQFGKMDSTTLAFIDNGMMKMFSGDEKKSPSEELVKVKQIKGETESSPALIHAVAGTAVMTLLFAVAGLGASLLDEKEKGTLKRLLLTPINPMQIFYGKMISAIVISVLQLLVMFLFANITFGLEIFDVFPALLIMITATAFTCACFGLLIALSEYYPQTSRRNVNRIGVDYVGYWRKYDSVICDA